MSSEETREAQAARTESGPEAAGAPVRAVDSVAGPFRARLPRLLACVRCGEDRLVGRNERGGWCDVCGAGWP